MKITKYQIACYLFFLFTCFSCFSWNENNVSITVQEQKDEYQFYATYNRDKTDDVQEYLSENLKENGVDFTEDNYNGINVVLNDHTKFYLESSPGKIKIKLDKSENSEASCKKVKRICDELKDVLQ